MQNSTIIVRVRTKRFYRISFIMQTLRRFRYWHGICAYKEKKHIQPFYENNKTGNKDIIEIQAIFYNQSVRVNFKPYMRDDTFTVYSSRDDGRPLRQRFRQGSSFCP